MKVTIIGVGLIGGSFAKDIKTLYSNAKIYGIDARPENIKSALTLGLIEEQTTYGALSNMDIVVLAIPVDILVQELPKVLDAVGDDTLVLDTGSTKSRICQTVESHPKRRNFLACRPYCRN